MGLAINRTKIKQQNLGLATGTKAFMEKGPKMKWEVGFGRVVDCEKNCEKVREEGEGEWFRVRSSSPVSVTE